jgi:hypothetical protein
MRSLLTAPLIAAAMLVATPARAADTDLEKLLPADTDFVVVIDANKLLNSAVVKTHVPALIGRFGYEGLLAATEDNPQSQKALKAKSGEIKKFLNDRKEVEKLLTTLGTMVSRMTVTGSVGGGGEPSLVVIEGDFSKDYIEGFVTLMTLFAPEEASFTNKGGRKVFHLKGGQGGAAENMYITIPSDGVILLAMDEDDVNAAADRAAGKKKPAAKAGIRGMVRGMDSDNAITMLADIGEEGIKITGGLKVKADVQLKVVVDAGDEDKAKALEDAIDPAIDAIKGMLADQVEKMPALKVVMDATKRLKKSRKGSLLTIEMNLTAKELDTLVKSALKGTDD